MIRRQINLGFYGFLPGKYMEFHVTREVGTLYCHCEYDGTKMEYGKKTFISPWVPLSEIHFVLAATAVITDAKCLKNAYYYCLNR